MRPGLDFYFHIARPSLSGENLDKIKEEKVTHSGITNDFNYIFNRLWDVTNLNSTQKNQSAVNREL